MDLSNILMEPGTAANIPKHVLVSSVFHDNHTIVQIMNIVPTAEANYLRWHQVRAIYTTNKITACRITTATTLLANFVYHSSHVGHSFHL